MAKQRDSFAYHIAQSEDDLPLARAALLFARSEYPALSVEHYLAQLDTIAADAHSQLPPRADSFDKLRVINNCLFQQRGFKGNQSHYYDPCNSHLNAVLEHKLGIPITLSIIYLEIAWRLQLPLRGISFPGHFLVKLPVDEGVIVLDPFFEGVTLSEDDLHQRIKSLADSAAHAQASNPINVLGLLCAIDKRSILIRLLRNLKLIYQRREDYSRFLNVCDHLLMLDPDNAQEQHDREVALEQLGHSQNPQRKKPAAS